MKRCPKCKSGNIYKRIRSDDLAKTIKDGIVIKQKIKIYRCCKCKHEFDVPIVGPRYYKKDESDMEKRKNEDKTNNEGKIVVNKDGKKGKNDDKKIGEEKKENG